MVQGHDWSYCLWPGSALLLGTTEGPCCAGIVLCSFAPAPAVLANSTATAASSLQSVRAQAWVGRLSGLCPAGRWLWGRRRVCPLLGPSQGAHIPAQAHEGTQILEQGPAKPHMPTSQSRPGPQSARPWPEHREAGSEAAQLMAFPHAPLFPQGLA